ncbi:hypothetical protein RN607_00595 [Demequina capsici]|uniref:DUF7352 domain-containing protein n=1 Tax=Demequina capsici TaxID=3075620 RepID=A0AA96FB50_9MICO|nr:hypothetical protein [Demequina sp. PMTSA13]WNM27531.1 hypothetical protein RN607_00595 [Demequina sp. PMTSA13]
MRAVWKYPVMNEFGVQADVISMPQGAKPLHVGWQADALCIWVEVDDAHGRPLVARFFEVVGTGQPVPTAGTYIGSCQVNMRGAQLVFHVYEVTR